MKLVLALIAGTVLSAAPLSAAPAPTAAGSLVAWASVQSRGFPKPPKQKSGFDGVRKKNAEKNVGQGRPKDKLDELRRRGQTGNETGRESGPDREKDGKLPPRGGEDLTPPDAKETEAPGTDLSPENHVRALRLEVHAMAEELALKARKDGVKLRSLADEPESDLALFTAFKIRYYQDLCAWLEACDASLREGKGIAAGLRTAKAAPPDRVPPKVEGEEDGSKEEEDASSLDVLRRRFLEFQEKSHRRSAGKEDRPLLRTFHERLAGHAAALITAPKG